MLPTFVIGLREGRRGVADRRHHRRVPAQQGRRDALRCDVGRRRGRGRDLPRRGGRAPDRRTRQLPQRRAGGARDGRRAGRRRHGHVHDRLDAPARPRPRGRPARRRRQPRWREGSDLGARRDGLLRRPARGLETAVFLLAAFQASGDSTAAGHRRRARRSCSRPRIGCAHLPRRRPPEPGPLLPPHRGRRSCSSPRASSCRRCTPRTRPPGSTACRERALDLSWLVRPGTVGELAAHRRARAPAAADDGRAGRLAPLRGADAAVRPVAEAVARGSRAPAKTVRSDRRPADARALREDELELRMGSCDVDGGCRRGCGSAGGGRRRLRTSSSSGTASGTATSSRPRRSR